MFEWELFGIVLTGFYALQVLIFKTPFQVPDFINQNTRDTRLDQIRGFAMIGIVMIHIHSYFYFFHPKEPNVTNWTLLLSNLSRFSVPVFIFGSSLYLKIKPGYWKTKFTSLVLPYTFASAVGYLIKYKEWAFLDFALKLITGQVFAPYYFVPLLFQFYILFFILPSFLKEGKWLTITVVLFLFLNFLSNINVFNGLLPTWYGPISILNYLGFFGLGLLLKQGSFSPKHLPSNRFQILSVSIVLCISVLIVGSLSFNGIEIKNHHLFYPIAMVIIFHSVLSNNENLLLVKLVSFIGKNSLFIFLIHPFVIHTMHSWDPYSFGGPILGYLVTLFLNLSIPSVIALMIKTLRQRFSNQ
ncbi:acyltransferase family protein [Leptospira ilyithenensis]|uniref:Acyltransferase n=1 Tax=Leptospira ilyithenensis TaxID=2484901 RepID=A0A4R9LST3_9LEPT|nr:acyltransferase [Leptospira ilyithenensis]TGN14546.1 acyltransferase [Leptospira ilyithenensis]